MYSVGWNKKLNYCIAFSVNESIDVTKRYTNNWPEVLKRRNQVEEVELSMVIKSIKNVYTLLLEINLKTCSSWMI